jgi:hypothetical protein
MPTPARSHCSPELMTPLPHTVAGVLTVQTLSEPLVLGVQLKPGSVWQVAEQPSPLEVLRSSHCSPATKFNRPSPHALVVQFTLQVAVGSDVGVGPSHCSPAFTTPLLQAPPVHELKVFATAVQLKPDSTWQVEEQPSPLFVLPSSQASLAAGTGLRRPSPQTLVVQLVLQVAVGRVAASHCSSVGAGPLVRTKPSPQIAAWQVEPTHPSLFSVLPSSQASIGALTTVLPQIAPEHTLKPFAGVVQVKPGAPVSSVQVLEQPSPLRMLPSSQASPLGTLRLPSPQTRVVQSTLQVAVGSAPGVGPSHCSPELMTPLLHAAPEHELKPFAGPVQVNPVSSWQVAEQPSPAVVLPSSQASLAAGTGLRRPSPQTLVVQLVLQVAVGRVAASHCSSVGAGPLVRTKPSPQIASWQVGPTQPSLFRVLPSSHTSPVLITPLPHAAPEHTLKPFAGPVQVNPVSSWHVGEQPSPAVMLPSSQASFAAGFVLRLPSPQTFVEQSTLQVAVGSDPAGAGSHASPGFSVPLPHAAPEQELGEPSTVVQVKPASTTQLLSQPSPLFSLPSSHASVRAGFSVPSKRLSPQYAQRTVPLETGNSMQRVSAPVAGVGTLEQLFGLLGTVVPSALVEHAPQLVSLGTVKLISQPFVTFESQSARCGEQVNWQLPVVLSQDEPL